MSLTVALTRFASISLVPLAALLVVGCGKGQDEGPLEALPPRSDSVQQSEASKPQPTTTLAGPAVSDNGQSDPDAWALTAEEDELLEAYYSLGEYEIRPPKGFRYIKYIREAHAHAWAGPIRPDETYAHLMVTIMPYPPGYIPGSLDDSLREVMGAIKRRRSDWTETPFEHGRIDGRDFVRTQWTGVATTAAREGLAGRRMGGVVFLTVNDMHTIHVVCQDVSPEDTEAIRLGSIATRSFRGAVKSAPSSAVAP